MSNTIKLQEKFGILFDFSLGESQKDREVLKLENNLFEGIVGRIVVKSKFLIINRMFKCG